jgi:DNA-binding CsgD family transcriptional regulator
MESMRHSSYLWKAVPSLAHRDTERILRFVADADDLSGSEPFTGELLVELGRLVEADFVSYSELDRVRRRQLVYVPRPGEDEDGDLGLPNDRVFEILLEHPVCRRHQAGDFRALKLSDFLTRQQLHRSRIYRDWFQPSEIEYQLNIPIPSPLWHTKTFLFDRSGGSDFTERDRLVLDTLQTHLARLWREARTRRLLAAALETLDRPEEDERQGVLLLGSPAELEFASAPARRLMREFFPGSEDNRLPAQIADWIGSGATSALIRCRNGRRLTVDRDRDTLLLRERREVPLTAREREVLAWVARGKTNADIAALLWVSPATIRKHLENVFGKLGVRTRTAAVASFTGEEEEDSATARG